MKGKPHTETNLNSLSRQLQFTQLELDETEGGDDDCNADDLQRTRISRSLRAHRDLWAKSLSLLHLVELTILPRPCYGFQLIAEWVRMHFPRFSSDEEDAENLSIFERYDIDR